MFKTTQYFDILIVPFISSSIHLLNHDVRQLTDSKYLLLSTMHLPRCGSVRYYSVTNIFPSVNSYLHHGCVLYLLFLQWIIFHEPTAHFYCRIHSIQSKWSQYNKRKWPE